MRFNTYGIYIQLALLVSTLNFIYGQQQCLNGGVLVSRPAATVDQVCICHKDFIGPRCETRISSLNTEQTRRYGCELRPCYIGSTCEDRDGSFVCHCSANTYGEFCQESSLTTNDPCISKPCYNYGTCIQQDQNSYTCACNGSYGGLGCKQNLVGACASNPCLREGICVPVGLNDYKCQCPDWTIGKNCELVFNPCSRVNCMNNGNCLKRRTLAYECNCTTDYTGLLCDQPIIQSCKRIPCAYGSCQLNINGQYGCVCNTPGYQGPFCEVETCNPRCGRGYCNRDLTTGQSYCVCASGYQGADCNTLSCFSGNTFVDTQNKGSVPISELKKGDLVKTFDHVEQKWIYSKFITYLHRDKDMIAKYLSIKTETNKNLIISHKHFILRIKSIAGEDYESEYVFASKLKLNDILLTETENQEKKMEKVVSIEEVYDQGAYAPLTEAGTISVNSIVASCYANSITHELADFIFQPLIMWSKYFEGLFDLENGHVNGIYWYAEYLRNLLPFIPFSSNLVFF